MPAPGGAAGAPVEGRRTGRTCRGWPAATGWNPARCCRGGPGPAPARGTRPAPRGHRGAAEPGRPQLLAHLGGVGEQDLARALPAFGDGPQPALPGRPAPPGEAAGSGRPAGRWKIRVGRAVRAGGVRMRAVYGGPYRPGHGGVRTPRRGGGCAAATSGGCSTPGTATATTTWTCGPSRRSPRRSGPGRRPPAPRPPPTPIRRGCSPWPTRWSARGGSRPCTGNRSGSGRPGCTRWPAGTRAGFWWWRVIARDAVVFPETVALAGALLDPVMQERVWQDHGGGGPVRPFRPDGAFFGELAVRLERPWLAAVGQPRSGEWCWAGPCSPGRCWTAWARFTRIRRGQHHPTGTGWTRGGSAPSTAPSRPGPTAHPGRTDHRRARSDGATGAEAAYP